MSMTLLKRSLAIVEEDLPDNAKKAKSKQKGNPGQKNISKRKLLKGLYKAEELFRPEKLSVEEIKKNTKENDKTEENVAKLLKLSKSVKIDKEAAKKIFRRAKAGHYIIPEKEEKKEEESIFTEEDFKKFEEEYFS